MKTSLIVLSLALPLCSPLRGQEETGSTVGSEVITDHEARKLVSEFKKLIKSNKNNLKGRIDAVESLGQRSHNLLVKPLQSVARTDKAKTVRMAAAKAIGNQPTRRARPALIDLLKRAQITSEPAVTGAIIQAISHSCYVDKDWRQFEQLFGRVLTDPKAAGVQRTILEVAGKHREFEAIGFLVEHIDAPQPVWVDDPNNPPAAYWEARFKNWAKWKTHVTESLYQITGQRFGTSKEARTWLRANKKALEKELRRRDKSTKKTSSR